MKHTIPDIYKKQAIPLVLLISLSLCIWFFGPSVAIANKLPFVYPEKRFYIITALFLLWLLKLIFLDIKPEKDQPFLAKPEIAKKLQTLQGRFQGALNFLKKTIINKQDIKFSLANLPWYLFIGPCNAGKTTFLANSNVNFILSKQFKQGEAAAIPHSDACDWWVTRDLVLIDVPGAYFFSKEKSDNSILWKTLLGLVKNTSAFEKLNGVIVALNLPEILKKTNQQEKILLLYDLKKRITDLRNQFGSQLSFHFVITKCDLLPGFLDFFGESGSDELSQTWGLTLPVLKPKEKLLDVLTLRFNVLIKRINKQLLWRLHQERNPNTRPYIKDFPLHLERLKEALITLLKGLAMPDLCLQGVYLTSAAQTSLETPGTFTQTVPGNLTHQALQIMRAPVMPSRAYFIKQLVLQSFLYSSSKPFAANQTDYNWQRRALYASSVGIIVTAVLLLGHDFKLSAEKTYSLQNDLSRYQMIIQQASRNDARLIQALPLFDALEQASNNSSHRFTRFENILSFYSSKSEQTANDMYSKALQTVLVPEIKNSLEKYLRTASNKNPVPVYTALKAYLMLANPENFQANFIADTLRKTASTPINHQALQQLTRHIAAISSTHSLIHLDENLISDIRKQLINLPSTELGFVILKNMDMNNLDSSIGLGTNFGSPPVFVSKQVANRIPNMFIAENFQKIISDEMNIAAEEALKGNWVLGEMTPSINQPSSDSLVSQLRNQYIAKYVDIWESQLANIQPYSPKNLLQVDEMIQNLTNNNSPLVQLLQTVKQNTAFDPIISASPKMQALDNLVSSTDIKESSLYEIFIDLQQLHIYLQKILNSNNINKYAFNAAVHRMENSSDDPITTIHQLAENNPEPLKSWLNTIANQSWNFILQSAGEQIQTAWQNNVMPTYTQHIANRFPFIQNSNQDVSLQEFTNFLGHRGTLANFYTTYLKPFVNDENEQWIWRVVDNQRIPVANGLLANLQHAAQMQHAFFPNGDNKLSIEFTMQPIALDPAMRTLTLNINGQQAAFQKNGKRLPRTFTWPGNYYSHATTVSFITPKSQMISNTMKGDWGLFRLINRSMEGVNAKKGILLNIAANGHSAKYMLFTSGVTNPFLPTSTAKFELPSDILAG
ncbi:MAG TPA: type VI secretion system membrane subunit TssM [Gammaproteobacteria bacterium]|nr:type VI secretion system membrane subunit TssM [Gammaproteobacteria bacterium]